MTILITGGAGYIGSNVARLLLLAGKEVVVIDRQRTDRIDYLKQFERFTFYKLDLEDDSLADIFYLHQIRIVMHFAALLSVPESVKQPLDYYWNNTANTIKLARLCQQFSIERIIFSSTAAVYGTSELPVKETDIPAPINPYGKSKLMSEQILEDLSKISGTSVVVLRYFNVAGAIVTGEDVVLGHNANGKHLIKIASEVACNRLESLPIYGQDFATPDGTGIRDYIHVEDLALAHVLALDLDCKFDIYNVGYSRGYSVKQVVEEMSKVIKKPLNCQLLPRREGDPAQVVADNQKLLTDTQIQFRHNLASICQSSYLWESKLEVQSTESVPKPPPTSH